MKYIALKLTLWLGMAIVLPVSLAAQPTPRKVTVKKNYSTPESRAAMESCLNRYRLRLGNATDGGRVYLDGPNVIHYQSYEKGWIICYKSSAYPVTGYILEKFKQTGGIAANGYPLELETNKQLENTNLNYQAFSKRCFWGCGITIQNIERRFYDYLKSPGRGDGLTAVNYNNQCPNGAEVSIAGSTGKILELNALVLCAPPSGLPVSVATTDVIYKAWKKLGYTSSRLGCPLKWDITKNTAMGDNTSTKYDIRRLYFEHGWIHYYLGYYDHVNVVYKYRDGKEQLLEL